MIKINLLDYRREKKVIQLQGEISVGILIMVFSLLVIGYYWNHQNSRIEQINNEVSHWNIELKKINKTVKKVDEAKAIKKRLKHILKSIDILKENQEEPARMLDDINLALPAEVWLSKFEQTDEIILLEGYSFSDPEIADFMKNLEKLSNYFTSIELIESRQATISGTKVRKFRIQCERKPKRVPSETEKA